jgi:hypothetical protein
MQGALLILSPPTPPNDWEYRYTFSTSAKTYEDTVHFYVHLMQARTHEEYPPKDGYVNNCQLNVIARATPIHPDLVLMWKKIGYDEICNDVNELAM